MNYKIFSGHVFIFHAFDIGDEILLDKIQTIRSPAPQQHSKYFKSYHMPLPVVFPHHHTSPHCVSANVHSFGVITLRYKIPFTKSLEELREDLVDIDNTCQEQSSQDAFILFEHIKDAIKQAKFYHLKTSYVIIHTNPVPDIIDIMSLKKESGATIASMLRFETETLSEYQKDEILATSIGYYRNELIIIDTEASFMYDDEYDELLDLFEFANMQLLELQYFDRILDKQLSIAYEQKVQTPSLKAYLPFIGATINDPVGALGQLRVDISVITERLENSIKLAGESYYSELYSILTEKLDLTNWKESINRKLSIIQSISNIYQHKMEAIREDLLSMSIIVLIFLEFLLGLLSLWKK